MKFLIFTDVNDGSLMALNIANIIGFFKKEEHTVIEIFDGYNVITFCAAENFTEIMGRIIEANEIYKAD